MKEHHVACTDYGYVKSNRTFLEEDRETTTAYLFQEMEGWHFWYDDEREPIELDGHGLIPYECHIKKAMERLLARHYSGAVLPKELEPYFSYEEYRKIFQTRCIMNTSTGVVFHPEKDFNRRLSGGHTIRIYSPLTVTMFRHDSDGLMPEVLAGERLIQQKDIITAELRRHQPSDEACMGIFLYNQLLRAKIERMVPMTEVYGEQLWCVLEVKTRGELTEAEHKELKDDWLRQMKEGWGMSLIEYPVYTEEGEMHIGLWDDDYGADLCVMTEEELKGSDTTG